MHRIAVMAGVTLAATAAASRTSPKLVLRVAAFALIFGGVPVLVYLPCSRVRAEPDRLVIVLDYGFFKRKEGIPRHLIEGAEVVATEVGGGLERRR